VAYFGTVSIVVYLNYKLEMHIIITSRKLTLAANRATEPNVQSLTTYHRDNVDQVMTGYKASNTELFA
jgi:hypothetical protein